MQMYTILQQPPGNKLYTIVQDKLILAQLIPTQGLDLKQSVRVLISWLQTSHTETLLPGLIKYLFNLKWLKSDNRAWV